MSNGQEHRGFTGFKHGNVRNVQYSHRCAQEDRMAGRVRTVRRGAYSKGITRGLPVFYPIFLLLTPGRAEQSAQKVPNNTNRIRGFKTRRGLYSLIIPRVEPRAPSLRISPARCTRCTRQSATCVPWYTRGVHRVVYRVVYIQGCT